ncbi:hypothetical protein CW751_00865 [Brumimicrobium salinarum]|uniref:Uncharacterized protein n=1 Tax=Brumimicrobium salinarum TaxID=2058658 RepID=A0A2I0R5S8_9FLAO|nr:hypothetical protein [Brumimicrobium salinarum]PKR81919.1 hypothetical protein CW751_00865 [Brumimicrobium salinarum]
MKKYILISFLFCGLLAHSQTKLIAHKSHSGSKKSFAKAYKNNLFDIKNSNFGLPGNTNLMVLDSVIAVNDSTTIFKSRISKVCYPYHVGYKDLKPSEFRGKTDTVYNHRYLNAKNTENYIRSRGRIGYPVLFSNPIEEVEFIGFKEE